jgi:K+-transporting ATPase A subunit
LKKQVEMMYSLLELEDNCRWIMNSIVFLLNLLLSSTYHRILSEVEMNGDELLRRRDSLLYRLIEVDPNHANRYHFLLKTYK